MTEDLVSSGGVLHRKTVHGTGGVGLVRPEVWMGSPARSGSLESPASDGKAQAMRIGRTVLSRERSVEAEHDVFHLTLPIGHAHGRNNAAVVRDAPPFSLVRV